MSAVATNVVPMRATQPSLANVFSKWTLGVPYPLLFVAGAAVGVLFASIIVLVTHSAHAPVVTTTRVTTPVVVAPVSTWQPNVVTIRPAADPMFDAPMAIEPPNMATPPARPTAKKAVTRNAVRRHPANKQAATGDLLTAAL